MAANDSAVSICNIGLIELGEEPITSLDQGTTPAIRCNARYDQVRRSVLELSPFWNCAQRQVNLATSTTAPLFTYANAYPVPADFIRMVKLPENDQAVYELMNIPKVGRCILTDEGTPLNTIYIFDLTDPTQMDPLLVDAIGYRLGATIAYSLSKDKAVRDRCLQLSQDAIEKAELVSAQSNSVQELDSDLLLRARR